GSLDSANGEFIATPSVPASLDRHRVLFQVAGDTGPFPPPASVLFTGPAGSQLADTGGAEMSQLVANVVEYRSPWVSSPPIALAGAWTEEYRDQYYDYTMADPQAASRLVIPAPAFFQTNGRLRRGDWADLTATGAPPGRPP